MEARVIIAAGFAILVAVALPAVSHSVSPSAPDTWLARSGASCPSRPAPPEPPALPSPLPDPRLPIPAGSLLAEEGWEEVSLGAGRLRPASGSFAGPEWLLGVLLPLYEKPGGPLQGWLAQGWLLEKTDDGFRSKPLETAGMVETGYEELSLLVLETCPDGWLRLRFARLGGSGSGTAWTHRSQLSLGDIAVAVQSWESLFLEVGLLTFRSAVPHALRTAPDGSLLTWIGTDHELEPLEFRGDWMRVRVTQPSKLCLAAGEWKGKVHEGWILWTSPDKGTWVWYPTRGC